MISPYLLTKFLHQISQKFIKSALLVGTQNQGNSSQIYFNDCKYILLYCYFDAIHQISNMLLDGFHEKEFMLLSKISKIPK